MIPVATIAHNVVSFTAVYTVHYTISLPYSLPVHRINPSMHVFMHQSINVNADGIIVPAALHCAAAFTLTHTGTERQRPGAGMYDWARMATKEGRAKNRTFFFLWSRAWAPSMSARFKTAGIAQTTEPVGVLHWAHACPDRFKKDMHHQRGNGQWTPGAAAAVSTYGTQNWRCERERTDGAIIRMR